MTPAPTLLSDLFPPFALRVRSGALELRYVRDEDLPGLCALALDGIHPAHEMPFYVPWTDAPPERLPTNTASYYWQDRARFGPQEWSLHLAVRWDGRLVGVQSFTTSSYLVTRTGETGSWLGRAFQGRGIGTAMRRAVCALAFDHLDAERITSGAFVDNPASLAVSRAVGYVDNGSRWLERRGAASENRSLLLTPSTFVRGAPIEVTGIAELRTFVGLDD